MLFLTTYPNTPQEESHNRTRDIHPLHKNIVDVISDRASRMASSSANGSGVHLQDTHFSPTNEHNSRARKNSRNPLTGSPNQIIPTSTVPMAPTPVQIA
ncbi:hypothetical protein SAMN04487964_10916 [Marinobacterium sediminicola]|uniref:Uncharacterized protein n=1 Tax=Marinobacterium sediminicola TaxID=518898 RepID=A0ABY1S1I5_9GAMM|nr:hypothetical protein SAMN04487964_10916 [Marinobacterium sediminicola]